MTSALEEAQRWLAPIRPRVALVLGSGLGGIAHRLHDSRRLPFAQIPGFPASAIAGHRGEMIAGVLGDTPVLCQSGRFHGYEGHSAETVALPMRLFAALGIGVVVLTNAAGGIAPRLEAGSLMLIRDQINLTFGNALFGAVMPGEPRFPDMSAAYDPGLTAQALQAAKACGIRLEEGVYAGVTGPSYETPAEVRMLRTLGADAVGMSTVQEVIAGRAGGLRCLGISVIANRAAGLGTGRLSHEEVLAAVALAAGDLERLVTRIVN